MSKYRGELIVEMLCEGKTIKQIMEELDITKHQFDESFRKMRVWANLPYDKRAYKARKEDILSNVRKMKEHNKFIDKLKEEYRKSLIQFDF